jgi:hypothetical protein
VRVVLIGITGPPEQWQPVYRAVERACRPMCFPFSPDEPETDKKIFANVVEYADTAHDLQGNLIEGQPTIAFCLPGIDRNRRVGIFAEAIPRVLSHHEIFASLLYFGQDQTEGLLPGILEARCRGVDTIKLGGAPDDFTSSDTTEQVAEWMVGLDPQSDDSQNH